MPPIRRYLRVSKYSVLECRIYLENPVDSRWLLDTRDPALPRVFKSIQPLVLPKLREETERARTKKSKPVKDVLSEDDFEVSIFLRAGGTTHSIITKLKSFDDQPPKIQSNSRKLTGTDDTPIPITDDSLTISTILPESDEETPINLQDIHAADEGIQSSTSRRRRRRGDCTESDSNAETDNDGEDTHVTKRKKPQVEPIPEPQDKKPRLTTSYKGFIIGERILCLLIARKGDRARSNPDTVPAGQALMEEWISTQAPQEFEEG
ncbi:conserved hypothetical protein [Histoplasma capsulatum G186AR]|uniref:Uncharacterized protein n=2 Tax=Ajellomyces capsulatus TaxID=5037 RepID=C0NVY8_AJECG|nr:uncharacterized protein HCBG_07318 [Histoplasma capsulatum G186AR]EEH04677.1 conserved hypothetical protein [Histoplasma capsulatum G186AR]KAG5296513.1 hypothetical protein I7I52_07240 [Histoplasma capsulatum]QSS74496.1 hypothetical protein I7I50_09709 [Histoplasma capsulatum G186AR]